MEVWVRCSESKATELLVSEIHATFLESGFVRYTPKLQLTIPPNDSVDNSTSYYYTLPPLLAINNDDGIHPPPPLVQVEFQAGGNLLTCRGHLVGRDSSNNLLSLNKSGELAKALDCGGVSEFRRRIKDAMCFPLLIDISEEAGLTGPNSFSTLPDELKFTIMAKVPGTTLAMMECVCSGLRGLSSSRDYQLWAAKFSEEEFDDREVSPLTLLRRR
ncbi:unnamed protein product, partial [Linum tenue]